MASFWTGFLVKIWEPILIGLAPVMVVGVIVSIWRFSNLLQRNTDAVNRLEKSANDTSSRLQALENWRDLISAQAVARELHQ